MTIAARRKAIGGLDNDELDLPDRLQSEADSARHAGARLDAGPPPPPAPASRPDPAAGPNQRWGSDVFLLPCSSAKVVSLVFALDCHDRKVVPAYVASPAAADGHRHPHADGTDAVSPVRRGGAQEPARDSMLSDIEPQYNIARSHIRTPMATAAATTI